VLIQEPISEPEAVATDSPDVDVTKIDVVIIHRAQNVSLSEAPERFHIELVPVGATEIESAFSLPHTGMRLDPNARIQIIRLQELHRQASYE
jgi:hypothetical protein